MASVVRFPLVPKARAAPAPRRLSSPIVGRAAVIDRVEREIDEGARVVTLTGPPGIGKTRTALACIERLASRFPQGGAWFCDLSQVTTAEGLAFAVLSQLRFDGARAADEDALARVGEALAACGPLLVVLDNFEQLTFAASAVARWCAEASELVVVVTSRERLAIDGEITIELKPLDADAAAQLFVKRARDAPGDLDDETVAAIVKKLEGIPLAIELAAARTRIMPLAELDRRLAGGQSVLPETLARAIAWSWDLLSTDEKRALARCSAFAGSFTLESAERVAGSVDVLAALRDKSLINVQPDGRLGLYVSIRDFASKKLDDLGQTNDARLAHARVFAEMSTRFNHWRQMLERADARAHAGIRQEKENVVAAIAFTRTLPLDRDVASLHAHLVIAASSLYALPAEASLAELDHAVAALAETKGDVALRALVFIARHAVRSNLGEYETALRDLRALASLEDLPRDLALLGRVDEGIALRHHAFPREAWEKHTSARADLEKASAPRIFAMNEACMGRLAFDLGDFDASRKYNERAIEAGDGLNDTWLSALAIANLAQLEQELGRFDRAEELLARAIERLRVIGEIYEAIYSSACGDLFFEQGKYDLARKWHEEGARFFRGTLMTHRHAALSWASFAALEAHDGDLGRAASLIEDARRVAARANNRVVFACVELHGASVDVLGGKDGARARWRKDIARYIDPKDPLGETVATSFEARFALRVARRMLERGASVVPAPKTTSLRVERNGRWFEVDGERVELGRRGALRRILVALATARIETPDHGLKQSDLVAAGWPGERVLVDAAATRVRVAIATLRQLGLRAMLLTRDDGYVLAQSVALTLVD